VLTPGPDSLTVYGSPVAVDGRRTLLL